MKIFSGSSNWPLAERIAEQLGVPLSPVEEFIFPDGERRVRITERVVDEQCIIVQSTSTPVDQHYMELFFLMDGLRRSGASEITAVVPYFGYQRQDHVFRDGEAVSLEVIIDILSSLKIDRLISIDMHSSRIPELFPSNVSVTHLSALSLFAEKIKSILDKSEIRNSKSETNSNDKNSKSKKVSNLGHLDLDIVSNFEFRASNFLDTILISPDMGGIRRIRQLSELLNGMSWAAVEKNRDLESGSLEVSRIGEGSIEGKKVGFIVDDMISSGETMVKTAELLFQSGVKEVYAFATHAVFSQDASELLEKSTIKKVFVTDSVLIPKEKKFEKLEILSLAPLLAAAIRK